MCRSQKNLHMQTSQVILCMFSLQVVHRITYYCLEVEQFCWYFVLLFNSTDPHCTLSFRFHSPPPCARGRASNTKKEKVNTHAHTPAESCGVLGADFSACRAMCVLPYKVFEQTKALGYRAWPLMPASWVAFLGRARGVRC